MSNKDTGIGTVDDGIMSVSSNELKWKNKIHSLKDKYPDDVTIKHEPEDESDYIIAWIPESWVKVKKPTKIELTDEQREQRREKLKSNLLINRKISEIPDSEIPFAELVEEIRMDVVTTR